jgi:AcrR family transcriptional regulator
LNETAERLMDLAQAHIRHRGYGGFSFRELAAEIGIKSASVHHHFPTKATMAAAVARRYGDRLLAAVAAQPNESVEDAIAAYRSAFREALDRDGRMCLCGVLGAEAGRSRRLDWKTLKRREAAGGFLRLKLCVCRALAGPEGSQGHGVTQHIHGRDAVLPFFAHRPVQKVDRSWSDGHGLAFPPFASPTSKAQCAGG